MPGYLALVTCGQCLPYGVWLLGQGKNFLTVGSTAGPEVSKHPLWILVLKFQVKIQVSSGGRTEIKPRMSMNLSFLEALEL